MNSWLKPLWGRQILKRIDSIYRMFMRNTPVKPVREWIANWMIDGKTRQQTCIPSGPYAELGNIDIPFVVVQPLGYFNLHQFGSYDLFENAATAPNRKWLILTPPHYELPVYSWQLEGLAFFDFVLRGTENGYGEQAPVRYWLHGEDKYVGVESFPQPTSSPFRFYLKSQGSDREMHSLSDKLVEDRGEKNSWAAIPIGLPILGGMDDVLNQTLTYETTVEDDVVFAGSVSAHFSFSCNEIDSHLVARLGRVDGTGCYHLLSMGTMRPARRQLDPERSTACEIAHNLDANPEPLTPGEAVNLSFSLTPAPVSLRKGEKLRLDVGSRSDLLKSDVSHGYVHFDLPVPPYFSRNTLHYGLNTYIELYRIAQ